ncbi:MAG: hypothetical protein GY820_38035 [Gammaproteobacteria bacterium]|nr:hypothetical protein [Gammaproteobacteria bacterium]
MTHPLGDEFFQINDRRGLAGLLGHRSSRGFDDQPIIYGESRIRLSHLNK